MRTTDGQYLSVDRWHGIKCSCRARRLLYAGVAVVERCEIAIAAGCRGVARQETAGVLVLSAFVLPKAILVPYIQARIWFTSCKQTSVYPLKPLYQLKDQQAGPCVIGRAF